MKNDSSIDFGKMSEYESGYTRLKYIGAGAMGETYLVQDKSDGKFYVAKYQLTTADSMASIVADEWQITNRLSHENIVSTQASFFDPNQNQLIMLLEFCEFRDLDDQMKLQSVWSEPVIWNVLAQIARGLKHTHDYDVMHLDLKPQNIFVKGDGTLKIGDFGIC